MARRSTAAAARTCRPTTPAARSQRPTPLTKVYDVNGAVGGPILKDRLWYFATARTQGSTRVNANQFHNANAGDPTKWLYAPIVERTGILRPHVGEHQRTSHVAGDAAQQDRRLLGRAVGVPEVRGQYDRHHDAAGRLARGKWSRPDAAASSPASHVDLTGDQPTASRRRLWRHVLRLGQLRARPESDARSDQGHRTVRCGSALRAARPTAIGRASSTARRTGATTAPGRTSGRRTCPTSRAATASRSGISTR